MNKTLGSKGAKMHREEERESYRAYDRVTHARGHWNDVAGHVSSQSYAIDIFSRLLDRMITYP